MQDQVAECEASGEDATESICREGEKSSQDIEITISLAPLDSTDIQQIRTWRNNYQIWRWCRQNDLISDVDQAHWFERQSKDNTIKMYKIVMVAHKDEAQEFAIGVCGFTSIDYINRHAEFSLYIAPNYQHCGFGEKALRCLLMHGFKNLGFNIIWGEVFDGNPAMSTFEKVGFKREGARRDFYFRDGKFIDANLISMRADEWN